MVAEILGLNPRRIAGWWLSRPQHPLRAKARSHGQLRPRVVPRPTAAYHGSFDFRHARLKQGLAGQALAMIPGSSADGRQGPAWASQKLLEGGRGSSKYLIMQCRSFQQYFRGVQAGSAYPVDVS